MWIIPNNSRFSRYVPGTAVSNSDFPGHYKDLLESLVWRSKPTPWRTWLLRLRRVRWLSRLCGRTCEPSRLRDFEDALISSLLATRASRSPSPASEKAQTIPDTFGRILHESLRQLSLFGASSRTSPDTLPSDSPQFIESYERWVTRLRQDSLQRQRSAPPTDGSGCLSWPTATKMGQAQTAENPSPGQTGGTTLAGAVGQWPTPNCPREHSTGLMKEWGGCHNKLRQWPTPNVPNRGPETRASKAKRPESGGIDLQTEVKNVVRRTLPTCQVGGRPDQASSSTNGKSPELWPTPSVTFNGDSPESYERRQEKVLATPGNHGKSGITLEAKVAAGKLNPDWVEQLQGLPVGWTDLGSWETG